VARNKCSRIRRPLEYDRGTGIGMYLHWMFNPTPLVLFLEHLNKAVGGENDDTLD
jgi:hypothetical protein